MCSFRIGGDESDDDLKDEFYDNLDQLYKLCPSYETKMLFDEFLG